MKSNAVVRFSRVADTYRAVKIPPLCQLKDIYVLLQCTSVIFPYVRAERYREQSTAPLFLSLYLSPPPLSLSLSTYTLRRHQRIPISVFGYRAHAVLGGLVIHPLIVTLRVSVHRYYDGFRNTN